MDVTGEGLSSVRRAFLAAGASAVVASNWQVNDKAAADLMVSFHRYLLTGMNAPAALRSAQMQLISSGIRAHPHYWSVFNVMTQEK